MDGTPSAVALQENTPFLKQEVVRTRYILFACVAIPMPAAFSDSGVNCTVVRRKGGESADIGSLPARLLEFPTSIDVHIL